MLVVEAAGVFIDTRELIRLWDGPRRMFLVVRRLPSQSVVAALPAAGVHEFGRYGSRWPYSNREIGPPADGVERGCSF